MTRIAIVKTKTKTTTKTASKANTKVDGAKKQPAKSKKTEKVNTHEGQTIDGRELKQQANDEANAEPDDAQPAKTGNGAQMALFHPSPSQIAREFEAYLEETNGDDNTENPKPVKETKSNATDGKDPDETEDADATEDEAIIVEEDKPKANETRKRGRPKKDGGATTGAKKPVEKEKKEKKQPAKGARSSARQAKNEGKRKNSADETEEEQERPVKKRRGSAPKAGKEPGAPRKVGRPRKS